MLSKFAHLRWTCLHPKVQVQLFFLPRPLIQLLLAITSMCLWFIFCKWRISVPVHAVDVEVFYITSENFDLLVVLEGRSRDWQGHQSWLSGTMNVNNELLRYFSLDPCGGLTADKSVSCKFQCLLLYLTSCQLLNNCKFSASAWGENSVDL